MHSFTLPKVGRVSLVDVARDTAWVAPDFWYASVAIFIIAATQ